MDIKTLVFLAALPGVALACSETAPVEGTLQGNWGGEGIQIEVRPEKTFFYLTCADGVVDGAIALDRDGSFATTGTIAVGPVVTEAVTARYAGRLAGDLLTVTITLAESGTDLGTYAAERDRNVQLVQCR